MDASIIPVNKTQETSTIILVSCLNNLFKLNISFLQSIERDNYKAIQVSDLNKLSADKVFEKMSNFLS